MDGGKRNVSLLVIAELLALIVVIVLCIFGYALRSDKTNNPNYNVPTTGPSVEQENQENNNDITDVPQPTDETPTPTSAPVQEPEGEAEATPTPYTEGRIRFDAEVEADLNAMTDEEKAAQLFLITPESLTGVGAVTAAGNVTRTALETYPVGGFVYSALNYRNEQQIRDLLGGVQVFSDARIGLPLILAGEEAGGATRSPLGSLLGFAVEQSPAELSQDGNVETVKDAYSKIAAYMDDYGLNLNLGLQADIARGGDVLYELGSFGTDSNSVTTMLQAAVAEHSAKNVDVALKCFPAKHAEALDLTMIENECLPIYRAGIDAGAEYLMLSNSSCAALTGAEALPCCLSEEAVTYIRTVLQYEGIIMTDSLTEEAVSGQYDAGEAAVDAINAGVDLIYLPADFMAAYDAVCAAVATGAISEDRLHNAAGRVLSLKYTLE